MVTKAVVKSINRAGNRCIVEMPLFATASSTTPVLAEALFNITPGMFNNIFVGDIVFVAFEENALEKPIIIGKLFKNTQNENATPGGAGVLSTLRVNSAATIPSSTLFNFPDAIKNDYSDLKTPKKMADYIKWLEKLAKKLIKQLDEHFRCFKSWTQWQLQPQNIEIDDGDLDDPKYQESIVQQYQKESDTCNICGANCAKNRNRNYLSINTNKNYPNT